MIQHTQKFIKIGWRPDGVPIQSMASVAMGNNICPARICMAKEAYRIPGSPTTSGLSPAKGL
jgi:hypothetical protein